MSAGSSFDGLDRLLELASTIAGAWGGRARVSTTPAQERAILRLFGVDGLDRGGLPLAAKIVERTFGAARTELAGGIALPFAVALREYDMTPQDLALDVAAGIIDLRAEASLLGDPLRRADAEATARELAAAALERIDANRVATRESLDLLGDAARPWIGADLSEGVAGLARTELRGFVAAGIDTIRVRVPPIREFVERSGEPAERGEGHRSPLAGTGRERGDLQFAPDRDRSEAPSGSQRGLALLRAVLDEAAAEHRAYVRLATVTSAFAAPEQAVVAAFERVDIAEADPIGEIVEARVDPDRALADHAFAHRLHRRAGTHVLVGAGPLAVGPELAAGVPADAPTRAGRAFALQAVGVALARQDGLRDDRLLVGALPTWLTGDSDGAVQAAAQVALRRAAFPGLGLAFLEPPLSARASAAWPFALTTSLAAGGEARLIVRRLEHSDAAGAAWTTRAAASAANALGATFDLGSIRGAALEHAERTLAAAVEALERLADSGWPAVVGPALENGDRERGGGEAVVERSEPFDPFSW